MKSWLAHGLVPSLSLVLFACNTIDFQLGEGGDPGSDDPEVVDESVIAGANQNDRSRTQDGDDLQTGAMVVSPDGRYIVLQRNTVTLIYDADSASYHELPEVLLRVAFAKRSQVVYAELAGGRVQAIDLATRAVRWTHTLPSSERSTLFRLSDDDGTVLLINGSGAHALAGADGSLLSTTSGIGAARFAAFVPGSTRALIVSPTVWRDGGPHTPVTSIDLQGVQQRSVTDVANCEAPIVVLPNATRAFLSPTYCSPGSQAVPGETWTNPDPVSVIELDADRITFNKNLPGFGPVSMAEDGSRLVAYLDTARMDPAMFDDPQQVPWKDGERYHLMTIDPATLRFSLARIGNAIPRFALTGDGRGLLVDASTKATSRSKIAARASVTLGPDGLSAEAEANVDVFGSASAFGYFDLDRQSFSAFDGVRAPLDRFVQFAGGRFVLTLGKRADGLGGVPFLIDLQTRRTTQLQGNFGSGVRDVGLSADGTVALLRLRLPANVHDGGFYSREGLCASSDGTCGVTLTATYEAQVPFAMVPPPPPPGSPPPADPLDECPENHDCW